MRQVTLHDSDIEFLKDACLIARVHYTELANSERTTEAQRKEWVLKVKRIHEMEYRLFGDPDAPPVW